MAGVSKYSYLKLTTYSGIFFTSQLSSAPPIALREFKFRDMTFSITGFLPLCKRTTFLKKYI